MSPTPARTAQQGNEATYENCFRPMPIKELACALHFPFVDVQNASVALY